MWLAKSVYAAWRKTIAAASSSKSRKATTSSGPTAITAAKLLTGRHNRIMAANSPHHHSVVRSSHNSSGRLNRNHNSQCRPKTRGNKVAAIEVRGPGASQIAVATDRKGKGQVVIVDRVVIAGTRVMSSHPTDKTSFLKNSPDRTKLLVGMQVNC